MDLLGGYGSGSDSEPGSPAAADNRGTATLLAASPPRAAAPAAAALVGHGADPSQLLSRLPAPSGSKVPLFSGVPAAKKKQQVVVQFRVPISYDRADVKIDPEEEPARKRQKAAPRGLSLSQLLPAPKNTAAPGGGGGRRLDVMGAGGGGTGAAGKKGRKYDSDDDDDVVPGTEDRSGMVEGLRPGDAAADGNEAFRVDSAGVAPAVAGAGLGPESGPSVAAAHAYDAAAQEQYAQWAAYYAQQQGHEYNQHQQAAAAAAAASAADPAEAMLAAALAAEQERAARRGQRDAVGAIEIKEVHAEKLKYMAPGQAAEVNALRNALGADYEAKLRQEAGSATEPSKMAKKRHQISSLYHYAKQKELETLEMRGTGVKSKAETQRKYGW